MYDLVLTRKAQRFYEQADQSLTSRLNPCFAQLSQNPYQHHNISDFSRISIGFFPSNTRERKR